MKRHLPTAVIALAGILLAAAAWLFWRIVLTPDIQPIGSYTIATIGLFAAGVLLICFTPLVVAALSPSASARRGPRGDRSTEESAGGREATATRILVWLILLAFVAIALLR